MDQNNRLILPETVSEQVLCQTESGSNITLTSLLNGYADEINSLRETISSLAGGGTFLLSIAFDSLLIGKPFHVVGIGTDFVVDGVVVGGGRDVVEVPYANTDYEIVCDGFSTMISVDRYFGYYYGEVLTGILLSNLPVGALVKDINSTYYGVPIVWRIADKNHAGYPANSVTLITDKIISVQPFDAREPNNSNSDRRSYGNNRFLFSNILQWLNSPAPAKEWYVAQHGADTPPDSANVLSGYNPYSDKPGFLSSFSVGFRGALMDTSVVVVKSINADGGGSENVTSKMFLASTAEVGLNNENSIAEGSKLTLFDDKAHLPAYPTPECVTNSNYTNLEFSPTASWFWGLRTPLSGTARQVRNITAGGGLAMVDAWNGSRGVRPLCNLLSSILVSGTPDSDGVYTMIS